MRVQGFTGMGSCSQTWGPTSVAFGSSLLSILILMAPFPSEPTTCQQLAGSLESANTLNL
jgi:hypothetical protein